MCRHINDWNIVDSNVKQQINQHEPIEILVAEFHYSSDGMVLPWPFGFWRWITHNGLVVFMFIKRPSGAPLHILSKLYHVPVGFVPSPPSFEAVYCWICGRRRVSVTRHPMICLVLLILSDYRTVMRQTKKYQKDVFLHRTLRNRTINSFDHTLSFLLFC